VAGRRQKKKPVPAVEPGQTTFIPDDQLPPPVEGAGDAAGDPQWAYVVAEVETGALLASYRTPAGAMAAVPVLAAARGRDCHVVPVRAYNADEAPDPEPAHGPDGA
jgi:hypothetical protein